MNTKILIAVVIVVGAWLGWTYWQQSSNSLGLPRGGDTVTERIVVSDEGEVLGTADEILGIDSDTTNDSNDQMNKNTITTGDGITSTIKEIMITDGYKHSVPLNEIKGGGPPQDGIPPIDNPKFITVAEADDFLTDEEPGIAYAQAGIDRFYPFQILVWHEIVNDTFEGQRALITYCPLCLSGIVFDPIVQGERVEFGTSGKLWNSNLVMYDRKTDSLWSQILGEAIGGEMTGTSLAVLTSDQIRYGDWKKLHSDGQVLSRDTGSFRVYGNDPYGDYYTTPGTYFPVNAQDDRLEDKDFVLGIVIDGQAKAYYPPAVKEQGTVEDNFAGKTIIAEYIEEIDAVRLFEKLDDGTLERINPFANFWFSWVAVHPDTELYK